MREGQFLLGTDEREDPRQAGMRQRAVSSRRYETAAAVAFVGALAMFLVVPALTQLQADSFRDLYLGRWIAEHGIPAHEAFAVANRGGRWVDQQWLSDLLAYGTWKLAGYRGLALLDAGSFAAAYAMLAGLIRRRGGSVPVAVSFASFAMVSSFTLVFIRAQLLVLPLFVALMWLCLEDSEHAAPRPRTLLLVPLLVLWANLHGSALLAVSLATGYLLLRAVVMARAGYRTASVRYGGLAAITALTVLATPAGFGVLHYYTAFVGNPAMGAADLEWRPPTYPTVGFFQYAVPLGLAGASAMVAWRRGRRVSIPLLGAVLVTAVAAALAMRNNVWLGLVTALLLAESASAWLSARATTLSFIRVVTGVAAILALVGTGRLIGLRGSGFERLAPTAAVAGAAAYAAEHPCALVLGDIMSVSALLWKDPWLAGRVGFDGRIEVYRARALLQWVDFQAAAGPHPLSLARGYGILVASRGSPALERELVRLPGARILGRGPEGISVFDSRTAAGTSSRACGPD